MSQRDQPSSDGTLDDPGLGTGYPTPYDEETPADAGGLTIGPGSRRAVKQRRRGPGCLIGLVILAMLFGGLYLGLTKGISFVQDHLASTPDYPGPGTGRVLFEVKKGDTATDIGRELKDRDVVASVDAFIHAADANPDSDKIQVGFYEMRKQMNATDAVAVLVDPSNLLKTVVTIPEGLRVTDIVAVLAKKTDFSAQQFERVLQHPDQLGLPPDANGNPEGYLFPATYPFKPNEKPADMLRDMVTRWKQAAQDNDLAGAATRLGYSVHDLMTMASLVQAEGRGPYMPKIARTLYNRLEHPDNGITNGLLQVDATVNYALNRSLVAVPTTDDTLVDSPYNTYKYAGLPPTPIEAPGDDAMQAATHPAKGNWLFYVTVNLATGETKFTDSYQKFLQYKAELQHYCQTQSDRC